MNNSSVGTRPVGVGIPQGQLSPGIGKPKTVHHLLRAETYAVQWADEGGQIHRELVHHINGVWYRAPNGENYAQSLRPLAEGSWLNKELTGMRAEAVTPIELPKEDAVSVMPEGS